VYCKHAKEYFTEKGVAYTEHNVAADLEARKDMVEKSGQMGVPVIDIDGEITIGFDKERLEALLNRA
jgi:glutaredoxin-like YruB-family protein